MYFLLIPAVFMVICYKTFWVFCGRLSSLFRFSTKPLRFYQIENILRFVDKLHLGN